ncbi:MAG: RluA family pseudouridine synthase [Clostridia bacterium]|nr:RluA family pseudouridine synthase [Clostridia bacterium]
MRPLKYKASAADEGLPVRSVLCGVFRMSSSHISRLKRREGGILLNGAPCYVTARLSEGDEVTALISDPPGTKRLAPEPFPLDIAYEDEWLIVIDKPAGLTVHPERSGMGSSVENALCAYLPEDEFVHTVSRLDRGTSGLMTAAKSGYVHERMRGIMHTEAFVKEYLAAACGCPEKPHGFIDLPLAHPEGENFRMAVTEGGMECLTEYEVLERFPERTLLRLVPHTGRMHQLRAHMAAVGCPLVGDWLYGEEIPEIDHAALHSAYLRFVHPMTGETVELESPFPEELARLLK